MSEREPALLGTKPDPDARGREPATGEDGPTTIRRRVESAPGVQDDARTREIDRQAIADAGDPIDEQETSIRPREEPVRHVQDLPLKPRQQTELPVPPPPPLVTPSPSPRPVARNAAPPTRAERTPPRRATGIERDAGGRATVHVAGFWRRLLAAMIDAAVILPVAVILTLLANGLGNVSLPPSRLRGPDFWLDLVLSSDPALMTAVVMILVVAVAYLMVFQVTFGQTLGMRVLRMRVIDVWGERPSIARCAARTAGYLVGFATVMLGFLWVGFDSEKRGLHDWIAGTYVIRS